MKVSVVVPCYNYGRFLKECVMSAVHQEFAPYEIIIVDDGSTDGTEGIGRSLASSYPVVKYIRIDNQGVSAARNMGIANSSGDAIALLDADDTWVLNKLALQVPLFNNNSVGVVYSLKQPFNDAGPIRGYVNVTPYRGNVLSHLMVHNILCASSAVVRRQCFERAGMFDTNLTQGEDKDLWLRIAGEGFQFDFVGQALVNYRTGGDASSSSKWDKRYKDNVLMYKKFFSMPHYRKQVTFGMYRQAWGELWAKRAYQFRVRGQCIMALAYSLQALVFLPLNRMAWGVVGRTVIPSSWLPTKYTGEL